MDGKLQRCREVMAAVPSRRGPVGSVSQPGWLTKGLIIKFNLLKLAPGSVSATIHILQTKID